MSRQIKFRVRDLQTNEIIGYEWIKDGRWNFNLYFEKDSRYGVFNKIHKREQLVHTKPDGTELYEGDKVRYENLEGVVTFVDLTKCFLAGLNIFLERCNWDELDLIKED